MPRRRPQAARCCPRGSLHTQSSSRGRAWRAPARCTASGGASGPDACSGPNRQSSAGLRGAPAPILVRGARQPHLLPGPQPRCRRHTARPVSPSRNAERRRPSCPACRCPCRPRPSSSGRRSWRTSGGRRRGTARRCTGCRSRASRCTRHTAGRGGSLRCPGAPPPAPCARGWPCRRTSLASTASRTGGPTRAPPARSLERTASAHHP
mmetsp:Transcript_7821/g.18728  ORF Transcript_7821/g.18728 Transcript_7821/m.18728 type:complete len:208 (-) Transcript_7821:126-749(-)